MKKLCTISCLLLLLTALSACKKEEVKADSDKLVCTRTLTYEGGYIDTYNAVFYGSEEGIETIVFDMTIDTMSLDLDESNYDEKVKEIEENLGILYGVKPTLSPIKNYQVTAVFQMDPANMNGPLVDFMVPTLAGQDFTKHPLGAIAQELTSYDTGAYTCTISNE
ncbi:MAG: hypothetical protein LBR25_03675 [Erysipelotrichaceae bacterium]|jgi:hypothetical protein|nr:hypothetical protein [Erysipelotrichaceae bacterium]